MREEIEKQGGIKLIYIDPPFDVGADFSMKIEIGDEVFTKHPNVLEEIVYRDTWGKGLDSFIAMIYERLILMRDLLSEDGSIYVHCDWRVNSLLRLALDEIFGKDNFRNELVWCYPPGGKAPKYGFHFKHQTIFYYSRSETPKFNHQYRPLTEYQRSKFTKQDSEGRLYKEYRGKTRTYLDELPGSPVPSWWNDIPSLGQTISNEKNGYPTQKPIALLSRIISASTNKDDLVCDFFCGSGTTAETAEKMGRKWICADLSKFAIHVTRKRLIGLQRQMKHSGEKYRSFEVLNMGKYERQHYVGINKELMDVQQRQQVAQREESLLKLILSAYKAERVRNFACFHGKRKRRLVVVGPVNMPVSRSYVECIIQESLENKISQVDVLGFEFELGIFPNVLDEAKKLGINIVPKYIPNEVFDKWAVERNQVTFHDIAYIEAKVHTAKTGIAVELTDFSVNVSQDAFDISEKNLPKKGTKFVVDNGQIFKYKREKDGSITKDQLTKVWSDWVDYWSVDFDFESKKEIVRVYDPDTEKYERLWTGDYIFENEWQSFRTKANRSLELTSASLKCKSGHRKIAVKVVDIFGNDTIKTLDVKL